MEEIKATGSQRVGTNHKFEDRPLNAQTRSGVHATLRSSPPALNSRSPTLRYPLSDTCLRFLQNETTCDVYDIAMLPSEIETACGMHDVAALRTSMQLGFDRSRSLDKCIGLRCNLELTDQVVLTSASDFDATWTWQINQGGR